MKQLYPRPTENCKLVKASEETIRFLTSYSKSLRITRHKGMNFESSMN